MSEINNLTYLWLYTIHHIDLDLLKGNWFKLFIVLGYKQTYKHKISEDLKLILFVQIISPDGDRWPLTIKKKR